MDLNSLMLEWTQYLLVACIAACALRLILGPGTKDRLVALNVLSGLALAFLVARGVAEGKVIYLDVALVYDIFGFLGFLAIAKFLATGKEGR